MNRSKSSMKLTPALLLFVLSSATSFAQKVYDLRDYGAKCDGTYRENPPLMSGTDDTQAILAALADLPVTGGVLYVPGHCRYTVPLTIQTNFVTIEGIPGWEHPAAADTASALMFDSDAGTALTVPNIAHGFQMRNLGLFTRNSANGLTMNGGTTVIENVKFFNTTGACPSCAPRLNTGKGIDLPNTSSGYVLSHIQVAGYLYGLDAQAGGGLVINNASEFVVNAIGIRLGAIAASSVSIIGTVDIEDARCADCGDFVLGDLDIINAAPVVIDGDYFEVGAGMGPIPVNSFAVRVDPVNRGGIRFTNNYVTCNGNANAPVLIAPDRSGIITQGNIFTDCPGFTHDIQ